MRGQTGIELSREDMGDPPHTAMCASMSEPHLPSTATGGQAESDDGSHSPFTSIPVSGCCVESPCRRWGLIVSVGRIRSFEGGLEGHG